MPSLSQAPSPRVRIAAGCLDILLSVLALIWLMGGVEWQGRVILSHGADLRRAALLLGGAAALAWPSLRGTSFWLRGAACIWSWLLTRRGRWTAVAGVFALQCVISVLQALALRTPLYDVGIFHQILWALAHGKGFLSTISGAGCFLLDHFSPSLALLVPSFWLTGSSPLTLPVVQVVLIFTGISAWIWLAERLNERSLGESRSSLAAATVVFALSFNSLWGNLRWGFHENALAFAALSWAFALLGVDTQSPPETSWFRRVSVLGLFLFAAFCKEILLVDVALALGVWGAMIALQETSVISRRVWSACLPLMSVGLLAVFIGFENLPHPADKNYFDRYYAYLGHSLPEFFSTLVMRPWIIVQNVGGLELLRYFVTVMFPWLGLPLWLLVRRQKESLWLLALLPSLASAALATYPPLRAGNFHYVLELWPVLAVLTVAALARLKSQKLTLAWAFLALVAWGHDPWRELRDYAKGAREQAEARMLIAVLPVEASVSVDELAGPWVAGRAAVTRWPALDIFDGKCPEWVVLRGVEQQMQLNTLCGPTAVGLTLQWQAGEWRAYK